MVLACCVALVVLLAPGEERLTPSEETYRQATSLYDSQRYQEALVKFEELSSKEPDSRLGCAARYWAAECLYSLERYDETAAILRQPGCEESWDHGKALNRLGWASFMMERYLEASRAFKEAIPRLEGDRRRLALYMTGEALLEAGAASEARRFYQSVVEEYPGTGEAGQAQFMIGESLYKEGRYAEAVLEYSKFLEAYPDHDYADDAVYGLGWSHFRQGQEEEASVAFNRLASKWPRSPLAAEALFRLGEARYWAERYQEAIDNFGRVDSGSDFAPAALYWTGWARFRLGEYHKAAEAFGEVRKQYAYSELCPDAEFRAGECHLLAGELHDACRAYRIVEDFYSDSEVYDDALYGLTHCHKALGERETTEYYRNRILAMTGSPFRPEVLYDRATERFNEHRFQEAAAGFLRVAREYPSHSLAPKAQLRGGLALFKADDFDDARSAFLHIQRLWPGTDEAHEARYRAAWALFHQGKFAAAEAEFLGIARDSENPWACDALYRSADCLYNQGLYRQAGGRYQEVVTCGGAPQSLLASAHNSIAWCYLESGDRLEAARAFAQVVREFPGTAPWEDSAYKLGELRLEMGDQEGAIEAFTDIASNPLGAFWPNAVFELVLLESERGNHDEALRWAERLVDHSDQALKEEAQKQKILLLAKLGRRNEARRLCQEILGDSSSDETQRFARHWLGRLSWLERRWGAAAESFATAAQGPGGQAEDYLWWSKALIMAGETGRADDLAERAVSRATSPEMQRGVPLQMGMTYADAGMMDRAVKEYLKVVILYPAYPEARQALLLAGKAYERMGDHEKARQTLGELVQQHPQSDEAGEARRLLREFGN